MFSGIKNETAQKFLNVVIKWSYNSICYNTFIDENNLWPLSKTSYIFSACIWEAKAGRFLF